MKKLHLFGLSFIVALGIAALVISSTGCSSFSGPVQGDSGTQTEQDTQKDSGTQAKENENIDRSPWERKEFVYAVSPPQINLDPLHSFTSTEAQIYTALYEGLVTYNPVTLQPSPGVAERWEREENNRVYRFYIRSDARYSNGDYITAEHVRDTLLLLINSEGDSEYAGFLDVVENARDYRKGKISDPQEVGIYAEEERVVRFELEHPAAHFLSILCHHSFTPLHPDMRENPVWDKPEKVISNGPFSIVESSTEELYLEKSPHYWDSDSVGLESLRIVYRDDKEEVTKDFNTGEIQWTEAPVSYSEIADRDAIVVNELFSTSYYFFSSKEPPYDNPAVRRALALLIPWEEVRSSDYMNLPTSTLVPQIGSYPEVEGIMEKDEERALELLDEEGFSGGNGLPEIKILIPEGEESRRIAEEMKKGWEEVLDISVRIEEDSFHSYYDNLKESSFTIGTLTWIGDFADPLTFLDMWTGDSNLNIAGYHRPEYDELISKSLRESGSERYETMAEAEKLLLTGAVVLPIKHSPAFNIIDTDVVEGWFPNPLDIHPFKYIRFGMPSIPEGVVQDFSRRGPATPAGSALSGPPL
ncbi:MAG: peptide ABC transporter substrate-binding protein [Spirochaetaceae bacterium]